MFGVCLSVVLLGWDRQKCFPNAILCYCLKLYLFFGICNISGTQTAIPVIESQLWRLSSNETLIQIFYNPYVLNICESHGSFSHCITTTGNINLPRHSWDAFKHSIITVNWIDMDVFVTQADPHPADMPNMNMILVLKQKHGTKRY